MYNITENHNITHSYYKSLPFNSEMRQNTNIDLSFSKLDLIKDIIFSKSSEDAAKRHKLFSVMQQFYLKSLREFEYDKDSAYVDLITCGEVISSFLENHTDVINKDELFNEKEEEHFMEINKNCKNGKAIINFIKNSAI